MMDYVEMMNTVATELEDNEIAVHIVETLLDDYDNLDDALCYLNDVVTHGCISGVVSELIYTHQQMKFFDEYYDTINTLYFDFIENVGEAPELYGNLLNVTWYAYEMSAQLVLDQIDYLEMMDD